jgi:hypothetical protein
MKSTIKFFLLVAVLTTVIISCKSGGSDNEKLAPGVHKIKVEEVVQTSNYTYLRATEKDQEIWMAINRQEIKEGGTYYYAQEMQMDNFTSKELKRTFDKIYFVQAFSDQPIAMAGGKPAVSPGSEKSAPGQVTVKVEPVEGGTTLAQLFEKRNTLSGKSVKIAAQVIKLNTEIMGKNWIHIQDGSNFNGEYDLTVTTKDLPAVGDFVIVEGVVGLNKDFGAGYSYGVIIEDAKVAKK